MRPRLTEIVKLLPQRHPVVRTTPAADERVPVARPVVDQKVDDADGDRPMFNENRPDHSCSQNSKSITTFKITDCDCSDSHGLVPRTDRYVPVDQILARILII